MLFRTVYGPELEAVYRYVRECNARGICPQKKDLCAAFIPRRPDGTSPPMQNVDDALAFLKSARLLGEGDGYRARAWMPGAPFAVQTLYALRRIEKGEEPPEHTVDPLYTLLLTKVFIQPDRLFVPDLYAEANQLRPVRAAGGLSREKIQAWKRVMEFLGVGRRVGGGFLCLYSPSLVTAVLVRWGDRSGTLQSFLEDGFDRVLPYARRDGDLARTLRIPLTYLADRGQVELFPLQDSPTRPYWGRRRYRGIAWREGP